MHHSEAALGCPLLPPPLWLQTSGSLVLGLGSTMANYEEVKVQGYDEFMQSVKGFKDKYRVRAVLW